MLVMNHRAALICYTAAYQFNMKINLKINESGDQLRGPHSQKSHLFVFYCFQLI